MQSEEKGGEKVPKNSFRNQEYWSGNENDTMFGKHKKSLIFQTLP